MCLLNLWEQVPDADKDPYDPWWQTGFTPLKTDKRVNGHRHTHSLYMSCDDHVINYSSKKKKQQKSWLLVCKSTDGPVSTLFQIHTFYARAISHTVSADQMNATKCRFDAERSWKKMLPDCFFFHLSAHIKQRYPSHPLPPHPHIPPPHSASTEPAAAASSATANNRKAREQRKTWCSATFQESAETALILFASVLMANEKRQGWLIHPAATHTLHQRVPSISSKSIQPFT